MSPVQFCLKETPHTTDTQFELPLFRKRPNQIPSSYDLGHRADVQKQSHQLCHHSLLESKLPYHFWFAREAILYNWYQKIRAFRHPKSNDEERHHRSHLVLLPSLCESFAHYSHY